jgi:hypothetical protein
LPIDNSGNLPVTNDAADRLVRLPLYARQDLIVRRHWYQGRLWRAIKEPLGLKYFQFRDEEYFLLQLLDGQRGVEELRVAAILPGHAPQCPA